jgi:hypothetical protein
MLDKDTSKPINEYIVILSSIIEISQVIVVSAVGGLGIVFWF